MNFKDKINETIKDLEGNEINATEKAVVVDNSYNIKTDSNGEPLRVEIGSKEAFTLKNVIENALNAVLESDKTGANTLERYRLLMETTKEEPEFSAADLTLITERVKKAYENSPVICGRALDLLNI